MGSLQHTRKRSKLFCCDAVINYIIIIMKILIIYIITIIIIIIAILVKLGFALAGTRVVRVSNPNASPWHWSYTVDNIPNTNNDVNVCSAVHQSNEDLFLLGQAPRGNFIAKLSLDDLHERRYANIEYWHRSRRWTPLRSPVQIEPLFDSSIPETTLNYIPALDLYVSFGIPFFVSVFWCI